ncbi:MAG: type I restriction endonuclease subunit R [Candidatus Symbiobacter sp.]|nr:type I restriction endonuclease subunit R [Candidatus Symbiobacter sp.]
MSVPPKALEADLELEFIAKLQGLKYIYRDDINDRLALEQNFRQHFETLNHVNLSDAEFNKLLIAITSADIFENSKLLRTPNSFARDDGTPLQYTLINIKDWCKNNFEVIHQLRANTTYSHQRYDVILLINGIPVVQVELKRNGVQPREAMRQIYDYKNTAGAGYDNSLLCFIQLFIVSNKKQTYYFANNNKRHFNFAAKEKFLAIYQHADKLNKKIDNLFDFADQFLPKCSLAEMIGRYIVLIETEKKLVLMRPYQIYAVKYIIESIKQQTNNGYIWHTTGSGKTLTSFKAATLLKDNPNIKKCLFVVDRKDLDKQTRDEFNKFQENSVEENINTDALVRRLLSDDYADKVIVTTIQKLGRALGKGREYRDKLKPLRSQRLVFIFDECHRSQFGKNHDAIKEYFPKSQMFGFTGTPIFAENSNQEQSKGTESAAKTTKGLFQCELHRYTITHAIEDGNVLPFHVTYFDEITKKSSHEAKRKTAIVQSILDSHDNSTASRQFNALFATATINDAIAYYDLFKTEQAIRQQANPEFRPLKIACVFSPPAMDNLDIKQIQEDLEQEKQDYDSDPDSNHDPKKAALEAIIADYAARYGGNFDLANFDLYYQDIQTRIKNQQIAKTDFSTPAEREKWESQKIDITLVVDMLLTGFDAKYLNTLYVDKNLRYHGLIQAFSRTNRVLNGSKPFGNIVVFSDIQAAQERAIELFSGVEGQQAQETWIVEPAQAKIEKLAAAVENVKQLMRKNDLDFSPSQVTNLRGNRAKLEFMEHFKQVKRLERQLEQYIDLSPAQKDQIATILPAEELLGFKAAYMTTFHGMKPEKPAEKPTDPTDLPDPPPEFDPEFVLFSTVVIDYDYIIDLIAKMNGENVRTRKTKEQILELIKSDPKFLPEDYPIWEEFIGGLAPGVEVEKADIHRQFGEFKEKFVWREFALIAKQHDLDYGQLKIWITEMQKSLYFDQTRLDDLVAPFGLGWKARAAKQRAIMRDLIPYLRRLVEDQVINGIAVYEG